MAHRPIPRQKTPRVGRPTGKFTQHRRLDLLREKLETHTAGLTLDELALMLRITTRSVRRYLRELGLVTEVESLAVRPGAAHVWRIKPSERGRTVTLRRTQAYALLAARRVFDVLKGSALFDEVEVVLKEIEQVAHRPAARPTAQHDAARAARLEDRFAYVPAAARAYPNGTEDVDEAFRAVSELRVLRFRYGGGATAARQAGRAGGEPRVTAHPYALVLSGGAITCVARDVHLGAARAFAFDRMSELEASEAERFDLPIEFDLGEWLHGDFGVARAEPRMKVLIEFDPAAAEHVRTRKVHPSQKVAVAADGRVRASMLVPDCPELHDRLRAWVLGFGAGARVLEPRELAEAVAREHRRAAERYA